MADKKNTTFEHELRRLEKRVDALVRVCDQLQDENKSLSVEAMIGRLKAMEQGT
jgi:hypothetical protein